MDTTIKVASEVRDRLARIAAERGSTLRDLVASLADATSTQQELAERRAAAAAYVREHLAPGFGEEDLAAGERIWRELEQGRLPTEDASAGADRV